MAIVEVIWRAMAVANLMHGSSAVFIHTQGIHAYFIREASNEDATPASTPLAKTTLCIRGIIIMKLAIMNA